MAMLHEFAFIEDDVAQHVLDHGAPPADFSFPCYTVWTRLFKTNEDRLVRGDNYIFVNWTGMNGSASKFVRTRASIDGCSVFRHCKTSIAMAVLLRDVPFNECVLNVQVDQMFEEHKAMVTVHMLSGRVVFQDDFQLDMRMTMANLDAMVIERQGLLGFMSCNTRCKYIRTTPDCHGPIAMQSLAWRPVTIPDIAAVRDASEGSVPDGRAKAKAKAKGSASRKRPASAIE